MQKKPFHLMTAWFLRRHQVDSLWFRKNRIAIAVADWDKMNKTINYAVLEQIICLHSIFKISKKEK